MPIRDRLLWISILPPHKLQNILSDSSNIICKNTCFMSEITPIFAHPNLFRIAEIISVRFQPFSMHSLIDTEFLVLADPSNTERTSVGLSLNTTLCVG
ncbi:hypothetical protein NPIL_280141 [Nephila pilipes]|uniref:Uncharacterized protein n=1 Tax=Nephila pilipes TaxID=299642 RepID=A0A8X6QXE9_NEPPI|nr:hypothetical protein NPIL_280141 [Nephila pilipes]